MGSPRARKAMIRIVLAESVTRDDLDDAAVEGGWLLLDIVPATSTFPAQIIYLTPDRQNLIHLVDDARLATVHAVVVGPDEPRWAAAVRARLPEQPAEAPQPEAGA